MAQDSIKSKYMVHPDLFLFGSGFHAENLEHSVSKMSPHATGIMESMVEMTIDSLQRKE
ncbi:MAG: hypothetical protein RRZ24_00250 [Clostridia bacterium]